MAKYLFEARYTAAGERGGCPRRRDRAASGGRESVCQCRRQARGDVFRFRRRGCVCDRGHARQRGGCCAGLAVNQAGTATTNTVVLMTPEEVDAAGKKSIDYTPPKA
jgi:hypothetical protein